MTRALNIALFAVILPAGALALPAQDVQPINNRDYLPSALAVIANAKKSVRMTMYLAQYYEGYPDSPTNQLLVALAGAKKRGVDVQVLLESSGSSNERADDLRKKNKSVMGFLSAAGVTVHEDSAKITTHAKVLVVDTRYTIIGSTNWTYAALARNNEASALIDSPDVAKVYEELFETIKRQ